jgi:hypothetical protein
MVSNECISSAVDDSAVDEWLCLITDRRGNVKATVEDHLYISRFLYNHILISGENNRFHVSATILLAPGSGCLLLYHYCCHGRNTLNGTPNTAKQLQSKIFFVTTTKLYQYSNKI